MKPNTPSTPSIRDADRGGPSPERVREIIADAIDAARYAHPTNPRERPRPFSEADRSDREYALRLANAAIASLPTPALKIETVAGDEDARAILRELLAVAHETQMHMFPSTLVESGWFKRAAKVAVQSSTTVLYSCPHPDCQFARGNPIQVVVRPEGGVALAGDGEVATELKALADLALAAFTGDTQENYALCDINNRLRGLLARLRPGEGR